MERCRITRHSDGVWFEKMNRQTDLVLMNPVGIESQPDPMIQIGCKGSNEMKGVGEAKTISIIAAMELGKRRRGAEALVKKKIMSRKHVSPYFSSIFWRS